MNEYAYGMHNYSMKNEEEKNYEKIKVGERMKVAFHTLGCKVNSYESQAMLNMFEEAGYEEVDFKEVADVYVVNTCTVTNTGDSKSRQSNS